MNKDIPQNTYLSSAESGITILLYTTMAIGMTLTSYGVYSNYTGEMPARVLVGILTLAGSYITIIGISTIFQDAYSNLYDDIYRPRSIKIQKNGEWLTVTARKIPKGTSLLLARDSDINIADYVGTIREFNSTGDEFKFKQTKNGIKIKNGSQTDIINSASIDEVSLYTYRDSPQCRWTGETIQVNPQ